MVLGAKLVNTGRVLGALLESTSFDLVAGDQRRLHEAYEITAIFTVLLKDEVEPQSIEEPEIAGQSMVRLNDLNDYAATVLEPC